MATLANQVITRAAPVTPAYAAAAGGGDAFVPSSRTFVHVKIGSTATTVTFPVPAGKGVDYSGLSITALSLGAVTSQERMVGPFPADVFADPVTGLAAINYSQVTGVTTGVFDLGN